ncbi:MAG: ferrous iron transport protein B [Cytophagales bacterium]|nr:ferrous iron transport protein B [Cytophagales bacterium]
MSKPLTIGLIGNPNAGKSSIFNHLTGLNQKVGNFPGVTVDKKEGFTHSFEGSKCKLIDLPGTYSIYPRSLDEQVVFETLSCPKLAPDLGVIVLDASNLKRNLLLCTQIIDLGLPLVVVLTMTDLAEKRGMEIDVPQLAKELGVPVLKVNGRTGHGLEELKKFFDRPPKQRSRSMYAVSELAGDFIEEVKGEFSISNDYLAYQYGQQRFAIPNLTERCKEKICAIKKATNFKSEKFQAKETVARYRLISEIIKRSVKQKVIEKKVSATEKLDKIFTHKFGGYLIFFGLLFLIFQAIYEWSSVPMDMIDESFASLSAWLLQVLPSGPLARLIAEGIVPGLGGIVIFVPQIAILFVCISLLEESGYMARVVFMMDKIMRKFGLNGRSIVPLISSAACAIPAVMAARGIENHKDRLTTIMVAPLVSCSARLPVYAILIALVVPDKAWLGFNLQGIALLGLYLLGFFSALVAALVFSKVLKSGQRSFLVMELPHYRMPRWRNVMVTVFEKSKTFVLEAGKVIMAISVILWALASYGPGDVMEKAEETVSRQVDNAGLSQADFDHKVSAYKLENSYAGRFGKAIEPAIAPLGYDWKIGIAIVSSFAAREVFVGTMATIYSIGSDAGEGTILDRMRAEKNPKTGGPMYTTAVAFSLLIFYVFAMQCMSTLAIVYRETKSWKWPVIQLFYMSGMAYAFAFAVYQWLS